MSSADLRVGCCALIVAVLSWTSPSLFALTLHVAPDGNDGWSGRLERPNAQRNDGPLATLAGARDTIRRLKAAGPLSEPVRVRIASGAYPLAETFVLEPQDSGTGASPIIYEAARGARPLFSGGRRIHGFVPVEGGRWKAHLSDVADGKWDFEDLYVNGRRATRAREPNEFWHYVREKAGPVIDPATGKLGLLPRRSFLADPKDAALLAAVPKDRLTDAVIVVYFSWENSVSRVASVDPKTGAVVLTGNVVVPFARHVQRLRPGAAVPYREPQGGAGRAGRVVSGPRRRPVLHAAARRRHAARRRSSHRWRPDLSALPVSRNRVAMSST